jgi:tetratricopeptide (TPR) repeat protein
MSSIIGGFNYDIFISYRQKDNKGDRWVSEFVTALKDELDATFKENISIYYDENPHDGLLETHDVDASLKEKMKCLVFIPIISRTYCDPNAFAWEHEFIAFIKQASEDRFGLKVTLPNGNVATRVLPVKIHELTVEDTMLIESVMGGVLRGIDFIYKSPGVNRPLRSREENPQDNQNRTHYRDQINKVANAINDIISSLKYGKNATSYIKPDLAEKDIMIRRTLSQKLKSLLPGNNLRKQILILSSIVLFSLVAAIIYRGAYLSKIEKKIAVFKAVNQFNDSTLIKPATDFNDAVNRKLYLISGISKTPSMVIDKFDANAKSLRDIRKDIKAGYVLMSWIKREGSAVKIYVELSNTRNEKSLWAEQFDWSNEAESQTTTSIARKIASVMNAEIKPEEERLLERKASSDPDLNMNFIKANANLKDAWDYYNYEDRYFDSTRYKLAINAYDKIIMDEPASALAYAKRATAIAWGYYVDKLDSSYIEKCREDIEKADSINSNLADTDIAKGFYYYYCVDQKEDALKYFEIASLKDPGNYQPLFYMSLVLRRLGQWDDCLRLTRKAARLNPQEALFLTNIGMTYSLLHKYDSALIFHEKAIDQIPNWAGSFKNKYETLLLKKGLTKEARELLNEAIANTGDNMKKYRIDQAVYEGKYDYAFQLAEGSSSEDFENTCDKYLYLAKISSLMNKPGEALKYYKSARDILTVYLRKNDKNYALHGSLAVAYAGLGEKSKAMEEGEKALLLSSPQNKMDETDMRINLAKISMMTGDYDNAFTLISFSIKNPSFFSKELLSLDPIWKPLRDNPEYRNKIKNL